MSWHQLLTDIRACQLCEKHLPLGARPVVQLHPDARILVAGQAPGKKVHRSGKPFDDASGDRLRSWLGVDTNTFYDAQKLAIVPMGFCYPGTGKSGDMPPRPECAATWRASIMQQLPNIELVLAIGQYAQQWHITRHFNEPRQTLTARVQNWQTYLSVGVLPLPHPSPRNNLWLRRNPWFETNVLPELKRRVAKLL
ncbi:uracil-DNA glycosylase family protein [Idiomarina seosinensis]|uniref:Uracil-DNA glycosylase n=1 Tax=Idiomarina seosinensis TaxID=281739 RepID=A0A432Z6S9_9GAMM|nr:uracil-DNA glycosylase family protein [Idiomarina seosinensis]RUO73591.1 uracil-DNA glycosylase [Idiomarina seosinensis]